MQKKLSQPTQPIDEKTLKLIERIANEHSRSTKPFGYLDHSDLKNEIWVICLEKLADFSDERGELENFLRVSVRNRLINRFKDITKSVRSPCPRCVYNDPQAKINCVRFGEKKELCDKWHSYQLSVQSRNSLLNASEQQIERKIPDNSLNKIISDEIKALIIDKIDKKFVFDFNELINGGKISKQKLKKLKKEIFRILEEINYHNEENFQFTPLTIKGK